MNRVIYYNRGTKCLIRLAVSLRSLSDVYEGKLYRPSINIIHEGQSGSSELHSVLSSIQDSCGHMEIEVVDVPLQNKHPLITKSNIYKLAQVNERDLCVYLDADTYVVEELEELFDKISGMPEQFATVAFSDWRTNGSRISSRIKRWSKVFDKESIEKALMYGPAVNTGVFAFKYGAEKFFDYWYERTKIGYDLDCTRRLVDEVCCQIVLPLRQGAVLDEKYNASVAYTKCESPVIVHYHGNKHCSNYPLSRYWMSLYAQMRNEGILDSAHYGDRCLKCAYRKGMVK